MRAMPSPTSKTRPTSRASALDSYSLISVSRTETISSALNLMAASFDDLISESFQAGTHGGVVKPIIHLHYQTAEKFGIDPGFQDGLLLQGLFHFPMHALPLIIRRP